VAKVEKVTLKLQTEGFAGIKNIGQDFKKFSSTVKLTKPQLDRFIKGITKVHGNTKLSKTAFEGQIAALTKLKNNVGIGTKAYSRLGVEIDKVRTKMNAATAAAIPQGGMFQRLNARFNKIPVGGRAALGALAGTATAGLGTTGQLAFAGGAVGGPVGAAIGAGIGATVDTVKAASAAAKYSAQIQRLEIALKGVTKTQGEFNKAQKIISSTSLRLNVPLGAATKQFTTLSASVIGAGGSVDDAEKVFKGVSEAIKATGGDAEDVQSAIRAMSQIFGKGKVSAEELQGQLGERLPGAVVKFAEASGRTLPELQKDLRDGTVGLNDVMKFVIKLSEDHADAANKMAGSTVEAGQRMEVALQNLQKEFGDLFQPIGAGFQSIVTGAANALTAVVKFFKGTKELTNKQEAEDFALKMTESIFGDDTFTKFGKRKMARGQPFNPEMLTGTARAYYETTKTRKFASLERGDQPTNFGSPIDPNKTKKDLDEIKLKLGLITQEEFNANTIRAEALVIQDKLKENNIEFEGGLQGIINKLKEGKEETKSFAQKFKELVDEASDMKTKIGELALDVTNRLGDAFADFFVEGKRGFADLARSAIKELQRIIVKAAFMKFIANPILGFLNLNAKGNVIEGGEVVPSAMGNVFAKNKIVPYAMGGIVNKPTLFPMANGMGLMGEAGPEAIMPLKRGANGKLGVQSSGGVGNIVVNVDASNSSVEGDSAQSEQFGRALAAAIQSELIQQQRPGGLLS
jgi:tape measure domain-containing protein